MKTGIKIRFPSRTSKYLIPGLSSLLFLARGEVRITKRVRFAVPDILLRLIEKAKAGSSEHRDFLSYLVLEGHGRDNVPSSIRIANALGGFFDELRRLKLLRVIADEDRDRNLIEALRASFTETGYEISLSPKRNFVRDYFVKALSWSRKTGAIIIESTKQKFVHLGEYIASLQLPKRADLIIEKKEIYVKRCFGFKGGKAAKWFLGVSVGAAGLVYPVLGAIGLGIAFVDP